MKHLLYLMRMCIALPFILLVLGFCFVEFLILGGNIVGFYNDTRISSSRLYILTNNYRYSLYHPPQTYPLNSEVQIYSSSHFVSFPQSYQENSTIGYALPGLLEKELGLMVSVSKNFGGIDEANRYKNELIHQYSSLFGKSKRVSKQLGAKSITYWTHKNELLLIEEYELKPYEFEKHIYTGNLYNISITLMDKRLSSNDGIILNEYIPKFTHSSSFVIPLSRYGIFKEIRFIN